MSNSNVTPLGKNGDVKPFRKIIITLVTSQTDTFVEVGRKGAGIKVHPIMKNEITDELYVDTTVELEFPYDKVLKIVRHPVEQWPYK